MGNETDFLSDYIFYEADVEGLTNNDIEIMEYLYGDDPLAPWSMLEWDSKPETGNSSSYKDTMFTIPDRNTINTNFIASNGPSEICEGLDCIKDFVDVNILENIMRDKGLELPQYIFFVQPNKLYKWLGVLGWTGGFEHDRIFVDIDLLKNKNGLMTVITIAHETWHLRKQPIVIRQVVRPPYEAKAYSVGEEVGKEYMKLKYGFN